MFRPNRMFILAAEPDSVDAERLSSTLRRLGQPVQVATSAQQVLGLMRRQMFDQAVIAAELVMDGQSLLAYLSELPLIDHLVAVGPAGDLQTERSARLAGAGAYLVRPVTEEALTGALFCQCPDKIRAPP